MVGFLGPKVGCRRFGECVQGHLLVLCVSDLLEFDVRDFLVIDDGRIVGHYIAGELGEIGSHIECEEQIEKVTDFFMQIIFI